MEKFKPTTTTIEAYNSKGEPICLENVPAVMDIDGKIYVDANDVARTEFEQIAKKYGLEPRDIALLTILRAKPGIFSDGEVYCKYNLNKMLFYQWQNMQNEYGLGDAFPHDNFRPGTKGPIPNSLWDDLRRLEKSALLTLSYYQWGKKKAEASLSTKLTEKGHALTDELLKEVPLELIVISQKTKEDIFPLDPETVMKKVHREFPEYAKFYTEADNE